MPLTLSCFFVLHCLTTETSEGEGGRIGEGGRNKGEEEVGIDLLDILASAPDALSFVLMTASEVVCNVLD